MKIPLMLFLLLLPTLVQAAPLLPKVEWSQLPPWSLLKFYPGDSQQATVIVSNNDISTHRIYLEFNDIKDGGLMDGVELSVEGKVLSIIETNELGEISGGASLKIPIALKFNDKSGNQYKGKGLSFLACIRFELGAKVCAPNNIVVDSQDASGASVAVGEGSSHDSGSRVSSVSMSTSPIDGLNINSRESVPPPESLDIAKSQLQRVGAIQDEEVESTSKKISQVEASNLQKFDDLNSEEVGATGQMKVAMGVIAAISIIVIVLGRLIIA